MRNFVIKHIKKSTRFLNLISWLYSFPNHLCYRFFRNNSIYAKGAFLKKTNLKIKGISNQIIIHPENRLFNCNITIIGNKCYIEIGKHCILSNLELWIEDNNGEIKIGDNTTIEGGHIAATEGKPIHIGRDCMFSKQIEIRNGDSHTILDLKTQKRINHSKKVIIGNHVWLGADTKVLKGSVIQDGVIVGTGSIVTKKLSSNSVYIGSPAKKVKSDTLWKRERIS